MKFSKTGQALLAAAVSLGIGLGIISCGQSNTIDYLYVTANKQNPGQISVYRVDQLSGALSQIADSPYPSGGRDPVAEVTSPNGANLYVANHDDNTIVEFAIGTDAKLYPQHTYQTPGTEPNSMAINQAGTLLFVLDTYQATYSDANPGPGALVVYPINKDGSLGTNVANGSLPYWPVEFNPTTVNVTANGSFAYVANTNASAPAGTIDAQRGTVSGFSVGSGGVLTALYSAANPLPYAGVQPSASASEPTSRFLYVTDAASNQMYAYTIGTNGTLTPLINGPFTTGTYPDAITIDPSGTYIYVANYNSSTISSFQISQSTGSPSALAGATSYATDTGPTCILVDPAFGRYLFTSNFLGNTVTGYKLNPNSGALTGTENSPYPSAGQPTCAAAVSHGNHPGEHVQATSGNGQ
ncbi:MAG TPA: beta-propeller fold lactonase family protein [Acidobacteriaceae bacterium]|nr:beta-propeller fold lactonase family protein [Acidobacteriaceae bacterium]